MKSGRFVSDDLVNMLVCVVLLTVTLVQRALIPPYACILQGVDQDLLDPYHGFGLIAKRSSKPELGYERPRTRMQSTLVLRDALSRRRADSGRRSKKKGIS
jgi:hypothetical protein